MNNQELKPCPFCGSGDVEAFAQDEDDCPYQSAIARCFNCDAQSAQMVGRDKIAMAVRAWNKRPAPPTPDGEIGSWANPINTPTNKPAPPGTIDNTAQQYEALAKEEDNG